jgi:acylphosphatase
MVQGVGYRAGFATKARMLGLYGWVRNRADGSVEATIAGSPAALDSMVEWARRGPPFAQVKEVAVDEVDESDLRYGQFDILPTA